MNSRQGVDNGQPIDFFVVGRLQITSRKEAVNRIANMKIIPVFQPVCLNANVVDVGSGAGFDSLLAAQMVGETGSVIGVEMTGEMRNKAIGAAEEMGLTNVEFVDGLAERLPVEKDWADVIISNGVINLCMDKLGVFRQLNRALKPGPRISNK